MRRRQKFAEIAAQKREAADIFLTGPSLPAGTRVTNRTVISWHPDGTTSIEKLPDVVIDSVPKKRGRPKKADAI